MVFGMVLRPLTTSTCITASMKIWNCGQPVMKPEQLREFLVRLERQLGKPLSMVLASGLEQYAAAFDEMQRLQVDGVVVLADSTTWLNRARLHELVLAHKLPSIWGGGPFLGEAGLASYQSDFAAAMRRAAAMAAQILN